MSQQQQDSTREHLRERVVLGLYPGAPLALPPKEALDGLQLLWQELREAERTRDRFLLFFWATLATLQTSACAACTRGMGGDLFSYFMMSAVFTGPIPLIFLCRRRKTLVRCRELMQSAANQATSTDCVAPLLDLLATPGLERSTLGRLTVLIRLLARLTTEEARGLTAKQCTTLASVIRSRLADPELVIAGLLVLAEAQEPCLGDFARKLSHSQKEERLREAATEYLKAVQGE